MNSKGKDVYIDRTLAIVIMATFCLFLIAATVMSVCMVVNAIDDQSYVPPIRDDVNDGGTKPDKPVSTVTKPGEKTGIVLPSITVVGTYVAVDTDDTVDVSTDEDIQSGAIALIDVTSNKLVAGKSVDVKIYPASLTKVMTLLVACENAKDPNALLTLTAEMISKYNSAENAGASLAFEWKEGYQITVEDALHMVIYGSDTYACWLLADYVAGSESEFVALMNAKAQALGLQNTHFTNCTGLYNAEHYTTCRDMAAIMAAATNNVTANAVMERKELYTVDIYEGGKQSTTAGMWSAWYTSRLEEYKYPSTAPYYAGKGSDIRIVSGKTGYETIPTSCFVTSGVDEATGRRYVCVQIGRVDDKEDKVNTSISTYDTREMYWKYAKEKSE